MDVRYNFVNILMTIFGATGKPGLDWLVVDSTRSGDDDIQSVAQQTCNISINLYHNSIGCVSCKTFQGWQRAHVAAAAKKSACIMAKYGDAPCSSFSTAWESISWCQLSTSDMLVT